MTIQVEQPYTAVGHAYHEIGQHPATCATCREEVDEPVVSCGFRPTPGVFLNLTLRCPECGRGADMCFDHGDDWKKR